MILRWPWIHENGVAPLTLHQYFKYCQNRCIKKVMANANYFTVAKSHFANAKFYFKLALVKHAQLTPTLPREKEDSSKRVEK